MSAMTANRIITPAMARPIGEAGVSTISSAAGRNSSSSWRAPRTFRSNGTMIAADFCHDVSAGAGAGLSGGCMESSLQTMQRGVAPAPADQLIVRSVFDNAAAFNGDDTVGVANG